MWGEGREMWGLKTRDVGLTRKSARRGVKTRDVGSKDERCGVKTDFFLSQVLNSKDQLYDERRPEALNCTG